MKKILSFILILNIFTCNFVFAEESSSGTSVFGDSTAVFNSGFTGQKTVTDAKLKKTIEEIKQRKLTKKQKKLQDKIKPVSANSDNEHLQNFLETQFSDEGEKSHFQTVMIPSFVYSEDGQRIAPGYYKLSCRKLSKNEYVLDLAQGTKTLITVKAYQTQQDLNQDSIDFSNVEIIDGNRLRLVYGSIDLNLVGYLYFK